MTCSSLVMEQIACEAFLSVSLSTSFTVLEAGRGVEAGTDGVIGNGDIAKGCWLECEFIAERKPCVSSPFVFFVGEEFFLLFKNLLCCLSICLSEPYVRLTGGAVKHTTG